MHTCMSQTAALFATSQESCAVMGAMAATSPALRRVVTVADAGTGWGPLQGRLRAALPDSDRQRLQPMFRQVRSRSLGSLYSAKGV